MMEHSPLMTRIGVSTIGRALMAGVGGLLTLNYVNDDLLDGRDNVVTLGSEYIFRGPNEH